MGGDLAHPGSRTLHQVRPILGSGNSSDCPGILGAGPASTSPCARGSRGLFGFTGIDAAWGEQYSLDLTCRVSARAGFKGSSENQAGP